MASLNVAKNDPNELYDGIAPSTQSEDIESAHNTNLLATMRRHQHTVVYQLLHTSIGGLGDERAMYFENMVYIEDEGGTMLAVE